MSPCFDPANVPRCRRTGKPLFTVVRDAVKAINAASPDAPWTYKAEGGRLVLRDETGAVRSGMDAIVKSAELEGGGE